jgi:hypothetical protein
VGTNLKVFIQKHHRILFYSSWLLILLIQAFATELFDDEAYYWVYSEFPAWGYFDHPPMIAMLIKLGYCLFQNELGVRLLTIILSTTSIFIIDNLLERKNPLLFYAICASLALAQIGGMMAVPDTSLMFFVALFFLVYKRFIQNMNLLNTFLLGVCIALMLYTKYHGILIVLFTCLSNLNLFRKYQPYLALLIALALFIPHIYWQHENGYPSVQFHLFERNSAEYEFRYTIEFILGQILLAGPLFGWLLIIAAILYKPVSETERALKFTFIGIYLFFLVSTIKGKAEANWTIPSFIGLIVLSHQYLVQHPKWQKLLYYSVPVTLLLVFTARVLMMIDMPPTQWLAKDEFHSNKIWVDAVIKKAGNYPVVFLDSYQKPSKYRCYSGRTAMALNTPDYRRNNYNFWNLEDSLIGKQVYVVGSYNKGKLDDVFGTIRLEKNGGKMISNYYSFSRILIDEIEPGKLPDNKMTVKFRTLTPFSYLNFFQQAPYDTSSVYLVIYSKKKVVTYIQTNFTIKDITKCNQENIVSFNMNLSQGDYTGKFAISSCIPGQPSLNSSGFSIKID